MFQSFAFERDRETQVPSATRGSRWARRVLFAVGIAALCAGPPAQSRIWVFEKWSQPRNDGFGHVVGWAGDNDGDGHDDIAALVGGVRPYGELRIYSGRSGTLLRRFVPPPRSYGWGYRLALAGDCNGDKVPDLLVGVPNDSNAGFRAGAAYVVSGKDGSVLHRFLGQMPKDYFGLSIAVLGDVDRDGVPDVAAGTSASYIAGEGYGGYVRVYSGRKGTLLRVLQAPVVGKGWGQNIAGVGDTDRDGYPDLLVGAGATDYKGRSSGSVYLYSGKDWRLLRRLDGSTARARFDWSMAAAGDVNRDGYADFIVGAEHHQSQMLRACGYAVLFSGKDGSTLHQWKSPRCWPRMDFFSLAVAGVGDVDGDNYPDVAVAEPGIRPGRVYVFSGKTGAELWQVDGDVVKGAFGESVAGGGDANGDGWPDVIVGAPGVLYPPYQSGIWVFSGHHESLRADKPALSLSRHESLTFQLDARPIHAAKLYLVLGSLSGTVPGLQLASVRLPLVIDPYFMLTLAYPNGRMFTRSLGTLDGSGKGQCRLTLAPGLPPALIGLTMQHAFLVFGRKSGRLDFASMAAFTKIVP